MLNQVANIDIEFEGVISLKDKTDGQLLVQTLTNVMKASMTLFTDLRRNNQVWRPILHDMIITLKLSQTFTEVCINDEIKLGATLSLDSIDKSIKRLEYYFIKVGEEFPAPDMISSITKDINNFLVEMANLLDFMEDDQIERIKKCAKIALYQLMIIREATDDSHLDLKLENTKTALEYLHELLVNRFCVLSETSVKEKLNESAKNILHYKELLIISSFNFLSLNDNDSRENQVISITNIATAIKDILSLIGQTKKKVYYTFDSTNLFANLNSLETAILHGRTKEFCEQAKLVIEEINEIRKRASIKIIPDDTVCESLRESCNKLKFMTKSLISAARNALENPNDQAQFILQLAVSGLFFFILHEINLFSHLCQINHLIIGVKEQVEEVTTIEKEVEEKDKKFDLRSRLLRVATDMNINLPTMGNVNLPRLLSQSQQAREDENLTDSDSESESDNDSDDSASDSSEAASDDANKQSEKSASNDESNSQATSESESDSESDSD